MVIKIALVVLLASSMPVLTSANQEHALRRQVNRYYRAFSDGQYGLLWTLSSRKFHKNNDNDKAAYVAYLRKAGRIKTRVRIKDIQITENRAMVRVVLSLWSTEDKKWFEEEQHNVWVFEKGRWLFDGQVPEEQNV